MTIKQAKVKNLSPNKDAYHVLRVNDLKEHLTHRICHCEPRIEEGGKVVVHNSYDGREFYEETEH